MRILGAHLLHRFLHSFQPTLPFLQELLVVQLHQLAGGGVVDLPQTRHQRLRTSHQECATQSGGVMGYALAGRVSGPMTRGSGARRTVRP